MQRQTKVVENLSRGKERPYSLKSQHGVEMDEKRKDKPPERNAYHHHDHHDSATDINLATNTNSYKDSRHWFVFLLLGRVTFGGSSTASVFSSGTGSSAAGVGVGGGGRGSPVGRCALGSYLFRVIVKPGGRGEVGPRVATHSRGALATASAVRLSATAQTTAHHTV